MVTIVLGDNLSLSGVTTVLGDNFSLSRVTIVLVTTSVSDRPPLYW